MAIVVAGVPIAFLTGIASLVYLPYGAVGGLLAIRRPRNLIGWLLIGIGWAFLGGALPAFATTEALQTGTAAQAPTVVAWVSSWSGYVALALFVVIMEIFPASRLPSGRWRGPALALIAAAWLGVVLTGLATTITVNKPDGSGSITVENPLAVALGIHAGSWLSALTEVGVLVLLVTLVVGAATMALRMRRVPGLERQQLRWLVAAVSAVTVTFALTVILTLLLGGTLPGPAYLPVLVAFACVPISIGFAVLRYRLYDIDTIINRAVLYGGVTALVLAIFGVANIGLQRLLETWTGGRSELLTGALGIGVGILYLPVRQRVRPLVDRFLPSRAMLTLVFTDIVGSTEHLVELGDTQWRVLLGRYRNAVRQELARHRGHEVDTAGDAFFATFEGPMSGVSCALAIRSAVAPLSLRLRTGIHLGECEMRGEKVSGIEVHTAARIMAAAADDEILLSAAVRDAIPDAGFATSDRGRRVLKGVPGEWRLYALSGIAAPAPLTDGVVIQAE